MPAAPIYCEVPAGNQLDLVPELSDEPRLNLDPMTLTEWQLLGHLMTPIDLRNKHPGERNL